MSPYSWWGGGVLKLLLGGTVHFSYTNAHRNSSFITMTNTNAFWATACCRNRRNTIPTF